MQCISLWSYFITASSRMIYCSFFTQLNWNGKSNNRNTIAEDTFMDSKNEIWVIIKPSNTHIYFFPNRLHIIIYLIFPHFQLEWFPVMLSKWNIFHLTFAHLIQRVTWSWVLKHISKLLLEAILNWSKVTLNKIGRVCRCYPTTLLVV